VTPGMMFLIVPLELMPKTISTFGGTFIPPAAVCAEEVVLGTKACGPHAVSANDVARRAAKVPGAKNDFNRFCFIKKVLSSVANRASTKPFCPESRRSLKALKLKPK
jgi:hypothetical protein